MYRSGYSYKDKGQERILAIKMTHANFQRLLLEQAVVTHGQAGGLSDEERERGVRVQWDPERSVRIGMEEFRSIQIGIGGKICRVWAEEWIEGIEDVTERAREMKRVLDEDVGKVVTKEGLVERGVMPVERVYDVPSELRGVLKMDEQ